MRSYRFFAVLALLAGASVTATSCSGCRGNGTASDEGSGDPTSVSIEVARVQSGLLRTYAIAIAFAVCILVVVFVAVR